jgi:hypothetical protein
MDCPPVPEKGGEETGSSDAQISFILEPCGLTLCTLLGDSNGRDRRYALRSETINPCTSQRRWQRPKCAGSES